jgi:oligopeptide/dipeptide ABC transporter ATP-binding protein
MIAIAVACGPELIIADEPTTALDVTVQAEILRLLEDLVVAEHATLVLITHDLAVVSQTSDDVMVMYGGHVVEAGPAEEVFRRPRHPYTLGLLRAIPPVETDLPHRHLPARPGSVPGLGGFPDGCPFRNRCPRASDVCRRMPPLEEARPGHGAACWHPV